MARDREDEVAGFARRVKPLARSEQVPLDRIALVVRQPLPYVYVAREVLRSAGIPCQMFDALPLAAEPYAAALDLVFSFVSANFSRGTSVALLRSPHFQFFAASHAPPDDAAQPPLAVAPRDVPALDRALAEDGYLGDIEALERLVGAWRDANPVKGSLARAAAAGGVAARDRAPAGAAARAAAASRASAVLLDFLAAWERPPAAGDPLRARHLRARAAFSALPSRCATPTPRSTTPRCRSTTWRRCCAAGSTARRSRRAPATPACTSSMRRSARFGAFDCVQLAGLVDGEWPEPPRRNIFYSPSLLARSRVAGGSRADRRRACRVRRSAAAAGVAPGRVDVRARERTRSSVRRPSSMPSSVQAWSRSTSRRRPERIFEHEALALEPASGEPLSALGREWLRLVSARRPPRTCAIAATRADPARAGLLAERARALPGLPVQVLRRRRAAARGSARGRVGTVAARPRPLHPRGVSALLRGMGRARRGTITVRHVRRRPGAVRGGGGAAAGALPEADAALERTRLFGSAIAVGIVDVVLGLEAHASAARARALARVPARGRVRARRIRRTAACRCEGVADRIDLLDGNRLRVIDYKTGYAPNPRRALQVPIYALCAQERLAGARRRAVDGGRRRVRGVHGASGRSCRWSSPAAAMPTMRCEAARARVFTRSSTASRRGEFPPRPHDPMMCRYCAYASVCRKDYVGD